MNRIITVLGAIEPGQLGFCHSHEHLAMAKGYPATIFPHQCIDDAEKSGKELTLFRQAGGRSIVDAQPVGCCRDPELLRAISAQSGVHIIASTGFHKMLFYPENHWVYTLKEDQLSDLFIHELTKGMYVDCDTSAPTKTIDCMAGQIKTALDEGPFTPQYEKLFRAAATASIETGAALMVHIEAGSDPLALMAFLERQGVPLNRVIFCHMDRSVADLTLHKAIAAAGIYLEYDTIGRPKYHSDQQEIRILKQMLEAGYQRNLLMALDMTRDRLNSYGGVPGLAHILDNLVPMLREDNVTNAQIHSIFIENPAAVFSMTAV